MQGSYSIAQANKWISLRRSDDRDVLPRLLSFLKTTSLVKKVTIDQKKGRAVRLKTKYEWSRQSRILK